MPVYDFKDPLSTDPTPLAMNDDDCACREAVVLCGEMLRDMNGDWPLSDWLFTVHEGKRLVVTIRVSARRH